MFFSEQPSPSIGIKGYVGSGKNIVTKHDKVLCGRKNAERLMEVSWCYFADMMLLIV